MRTFLFGATSILGWNIARMAKPGTIVPFCNPYIKHDACRDWQRIRIEREDELTALFESQQPDVLLHCGGICDVEKCENNPDWAHTLNVHSMQNILDTLPTKTRLVYVSSDHVFSGSDVPYVETDAPCPISVYGETRVKAESFVLEQRPDALIIRPGLAIGPSIDGKTGHLDWLAYRSREGLPITIVEDEYRSAIHVEDLVARVRALAASDITGIRHIAATRAVSRLELATYLNEGFKIGASFSTVTRDTRDTPHLGRVELGTVYKDAWAAALPSAMDLSLC